MSPLRAPKFRLATMIGLGLVLFLGLVCVAKTTPDTSVKQILCNTASYNGTEAYAFSVGVVKLRLLDFTSMTLGYDFYTVSSWRVAPCYGHATCNQDLSERDCHDCMSKAKEHMDALCWNRIGAQVELADCFMRYEDHQI